MKISQILQGKAVNALYTVSSDQTVLDALKLMAEKNIGAVLVVDAGQLTGIFSERDYARKVILKDRSSGDTRISEVMTAQVITIEPDQRLEECMEIMSDKHIRHLPVVNEGGDAFGDVAELTDNGAHQNLVVRSTDENGKAVDRLIPFVGAFVRTVDLQRRRIVVDWQLDY